MPPFHPEEQFQLGYRSKDCMNITPWAERHESIIGRLVTVVYLCSYIQTEEDTKRDKRTGKRTQQDCPISGGTHYW